MATQKIMPTAFPSFSSIRSLTNINFFYKSLTSVAFPTNSNFSGFLLETRTYFAPPISGPLESLARQTYAGWAYFWPRAFVVLNILVYQVVKFDKSKHQTVQSKIAIIYMGAS